MHLYGPDLPTHRLLEEIRRLLHQKGRDEQLALRPGVSARALADLAMSRDRFVVPSTISSIFYSVDGQPQGATPFAAERGWRLVSLEEAMALRREAEPVEAEQGWLPLFVDAEGDAVCYVGKPHEPLRYYYRDTELPSLHALLLEILIGLGSLGLEAASPLRIPALCEELDVLTVAYGKGSGWSPRFNPGASDEKLSELSTAYGELPAEVSALLRWHDGQHESPEDRRLTRLHVGVPGILMSVDEILSARELMGEEAIWRDEWLPLFRAEKTLLVYLLSGAQRAALLRVDRTTGAASLLSGKLEDFLWQGVLRHRKEREAEAASRELSEAAAPAPEQRWVLAVGAILIAINQQNPLLLGGARRLTGASSVLRGLSRWWGVDERTGAMQVLEHLLAPHEAARPAGGSGDDSGVSLAWDCGRAAWVAGSAYVCGLVSAAEAWAYQLRAARLVRTAFASWKGFGEAYADGRMGWASGEGEDSAEGLGSEAHLAVARLLAKGGAWAELAWDLPLGEPEPPLPPSPTVRVRTSEELVAACETAVPGSTVLLEPGDYHGSVTLSADLRFEALGEVRWHATVTGACLRERYEQSVELVGIHFLARGFEQGENPRAVEVHAGLVRFVRCRFTSVMQSASAHGGRVFFEDCSFDEALAAVEGYGRSVVDLRSCQIAGARANAVSIEGSGAKAFLTDVTVEGSAAHCVYVAEAAATLRNTTLAHSGFAAVAGVNAKLDVEQLRIEAFAGIQLNGGSLAARHLETKTHNAGVELSGVSEALLTEVTLTSTASSAFIARGCNADAVHVRDASFQCGGFSLIELRDLDAPIVFKGCCFGSAPEWYGMQITDCRHVMVYGSSFMPGTKAVIFTKSSQVELHDCSFEPGGAQAAWVQGASSLEATRCTLSGFRASGVLVAAGSSARLIDCTLKDAAGHGLIVGGRLEARGLTLRGLTGVNLCLTASGRAVVMDSAIEGGNCIYLEPSEGGAPALLMLESRFAEPTNSGVMVSAGEALLVGCTIRGADEGVCHKGVKSQVIDCDIDGGAATGVSAHAGEVQVVGGRVGGKQVAVLATQGRLVATGSRLVGGTEGVHEATDGSIELVGCELEPLGGKLGEPKGVTVLPAPELPAPVGLEALTRGYRLTLEVPKSWPPAAAALREEQLARLAARWPGEPPPRPELEGIHWGNTLEGFGRLLLGDANGRCLWAAGQILHVAVPDPETAASLDRAYREWLRDPSQIVWAMELGNADLAAALPWQHVVRALTTCDLPDFPKSGTYRVRTHPVRRHGAGGFELLLEAPNDDMAARFGSRCDALSELLGHAEGRDDARLRARWVVPGGEVQLGVPNEVLVARVTVRAAGGESH